MPERLDGLWSDGVDAAPPEDEVAQLRHIGEHVQAEDSDTGKIVARKVESLKAVCQHCGCYPRNLRRTNLHLPAIAGWMRSKLRSHNQIFFLL